MPEVHAILSASSSKRWLNCTPSARLEQNFPNESSVYAEEGTAAHALGEYKLRKYLHERVKRQPLNMRMRRWKRTRISMRSSSFPQWSVSRRPVRIPLVMVEERLDYSYLVPSGFGTGRLRDIATVRFMSWTTRTANIF